MVWEFGKGSGNETSNVCELGYIRTACMKSLGIKLGMRMQMVWKWDRPGHEPGLKPLLIICAHSQRSNEGTVSSITLKG